MKGEGKHRSRKNRKQFEENFKYLIESRARLAKVIAAVEGDYEAISDLSDVETVTIKTKKKKKSEIGKKINKIKRSRLKQKRLKKSQACIKRHLGALDAVKIRTYGSGKKLKRVFTFKCPECNVSIEIDLARHLVKKHKYDKKAAGMKQSELRVMFLWAKEPKVGSQLPLPCEECHKWHKRLDHHLKKKHPMPVSEQKRLLSTLREKIWGSKTTHCSGNSQYSANSENMNIHEGQEAPSQQNESSSEDEMHFVRRASSSRKKLINGEGKNYLPPGAFQLTPELLDKWRIADEDFFHIYYKTKATLMNAFVDDLRQGGMTKELALQHANQVELIWGVLDQTFSMFPRSVLTNKYTLQDKYHRPTLKEVGRGGVEASTLRSRYTSLNNFTCFIRKRGIFAGLLRRDITFLQENMKDLNKELSSKISQRKVTIRREKKKQLMTAHHMIAYGRSKHVQTIVKIFKSISGVKLSQRVAVDCRDYLVCEMTMMNGLRASNVLQLRLSDVTNASNNCDYPGQKVIENIKYKTSSIYGEKLIALPGPLFIQLEKYVKYCRPVLLGEKKSSRLFVSTSDKAKLSQSNIAASLTSSFGKANVFSQNEYKRVSCTRIRVGCATFACNTGGIDMGYLAKHFMKNREQTTALHYNMLANHRDALCLASLIGDSFEIYGGQTVVIKDLERKALTNAMTEQKLPKRQQVLDWMKQKDPTVTDLELKKASEFLDDLCEDAPNKESVKTFYGDKSVRQYSYYLFC